LCTACFSVPRVACQTCKMELHPTEFSGTRHSSNETHYNKANVQLPTQPVIKKTPWPESERELYRPSDRRLSAKLVPTFADRGCHVVSVMYSLRPYSQFLDRSNTLAIIHQGRNTQNYITLKFYLSLNHYTEYLCNDAHNSSH
jgi:hypothetical protein